DPPPPQTSPLSLHDALPILTANWSEKNGAQTSIDDSGCMCNPKKRYGVAGGVRTKGCFDRRKRLTRLRTYSRARSRGRSCVKRRSEEHTSELQSRGHLVCRL